MPKGKAQADAKAQHTWKHVSILRRFDELLNIHKTGVKSRIHQQGNAALGY
jgi:hypothetical protein